MAKLTVEPTKAQYKIFDTIVSWPIIRILKPIYEWKRSFWIYCVLGFVSVVVDFIFTYILEKILPFSATLYTTVAFLASTLISFVLFRYLYFDRTNNSFQNELIKFIPTRIFTFLISEASILIFVDILEANIWIVKSILIPVTAITNYLTSKAFVFKDKKTA